MANANLIATWSMTLNKLPGFFDKGMLQPLEFELSLFDHAIPCGGQALKRHGPWHRASVFP
jgi:hypothetical protein